ncbi:MAG: hypothetical protein A2Y03_04240 [Omnitrophica WOR_2 bacterium GWF2_38_59]|nr:MAG: hypothetical protein A2Y03_04240 [Omnitrophica WOR_2 bacterium GWF2_38_59]OGX52022.1 MAG: hypothetical protein A2267_00555 [Omnitrophica WOR_2 bacterium RIFOXYA12_FULL_38_10]OGX55266.1 MAG: hypothetical protein A2447_01500 [Omnitrophica WOR_2 bacterium RIFOXYC2_FULL_38_12]
MREDIGHNKEQQTTGVSSDLSANKNTFFFDPKLKDLYLEFFEIVTISMSQGIDKNKVESLLLIIIKTFKLHISNNLLLYSYSVSKQNYIVSHIVNNTILAISFGCWLNLSDNDLLDVGLCAFCHDLGMKEYTNLFQRGHQLTDEENQLIKKHPQKSIDIIKNLFPERIINAVLDVHENEDGSGYPNRKMGAEISYIAKIVSICDIYEALTHPRNFRNEFSPYEAIKMIIKKKGAFFDETILKKFVNFLSIYPIGSLIYLNTGETAIVIGSNRGYPTRSIVKILLNANREAEKEEKFINLLDDKMVYICGPVEPKGVKEILHFLKPRGDFDL